jgi:hypothetical protein
LADLITAQASWAWAVASDRGSEAPDPKRQTKKLREALAFLAKVAMASAAAREASEWLAGAVRATLTACRAPGQGLFPASWGRAGMELEPAFLASAAAWGEPE